MRKHKLGQLKFIKKSSIKHYILITTLQHYSTTVINKKYYPFFIKILIKKISLNILFQKK